MSRMKTSTASILPVFFVLAVAACSRPEPHAPIAPTPAVSPPAFVNRVWKVAESTGMTPGQLVAFLSDGTLVHASAQGTPSFGRWSYDGETVTMVEEGISYRVEILALSERELKLRSHNPGGAVDTRFVPADEPLTATSSPTAPAPIAEGVVRGTVSYRERMALPADAELDVWITDTTPGLPIAAVVTAEATVRPEGRQVPIPFELRYDPARIDPTHMYGLEAVLKAGGETLFETPDAIAVITKGSPSQVEVWLRRAVAPTPPPAADLTGTAWRLEDLGGAPALPDVTATLEFLEGGRVGGRGSCNRFFGSAEISGEKIAFGQIGSTMMGCAADVARQEAAYFRALKDAERFSVEGARLLLHVKGMERPLRFSRTEPAAPK
jgi:putative lipoprotein